MNITQAIESVSKELYNSRSPQTARSYTTSIHLFVEFLAEFGLGAKSDVTAIQPKFFIQYPNWLKSKEFSKATVNARLSGVEFFREWLSINDYVDFSQKQIDKYHAAKKSAQAMREELLPKIPPAGSADSMVDIIRSMPMDNLSAMRNKALILFLFWSACRVSEAASLKVSDFDFTEKWVRIKGKGSKEHDIPLHDEAIEALQAYWNARKWKDVASPAFGNHAFNATTKSLSTNAMREIVQELAKQAGVDHFSPHKFRHNRITEIVQNTKNIALAQAFAGHSNIATTQRYTHLRNEDLRDALNGKNQ